jgi:predicted dehydrogenase
MTRNSLSRRSFLTSSAAAGAFVAVAPGAKVLGASERLNVGCIGTGGRARHLMQNFKDVPNIRIAAVCDIWDKHLAEGKKFANDEKILTTKAYKEVLDSKDIDAVLIGTPDHLHVPLTIAACAAGKDVYVEKPLTHDLSEGQAVIEAQNKHNKIVQVGMQQRSMPQFQKAYEILKSGRLGKIHKVHLTWNRNTDRVRKNPLNIDPKSVDWKAFLGKAPEQPFDEYRFRNWRWFWDFGGGIFTDLMVHFIDVVHWYMDVDHPIAATSIGSHTVSKDVWQTPDTVQTLLTYPNDLQVYFEGTFCNARNGAMLEFMGTEATLYLDRGRYEVIPEKKRLKPGEAFKVEEFILGAGDRGRDFYDKPNGEVVHLANWVECVKSRKKPTAPVEAGVSAASAAHLANQALRTGQAVKWKG